MTARRTTVALIGLTLLAACGRPAPDADATADRGASVSGNGFTLASTRVDLPDDASNYPAGPGVDAVEANCTGCHSPSMVLTQPPLKPEQWKAEVTKMREVYKAPVAEKDVPAILAYLTATSARTSGSAVPR